MLLSCLLLLLGFYIADGHYDPLEHTNQKNKTEHDSRRILKGKKIYETRPYMVYLRPAKPQTDPNWLCGGVIIHSRYILTSAACIEDVTNFFIVSGTHTWLPQAKINDCIKNGAIKAIWKCVPKTYRFDGAYYNNINWMINDIAVVMTAEPFNFEKRVKGCDFIPHAIAFNTRSLELEKAGVKGSVAGWGSTEQFYDPADAQPPALENRLSVNSPQLMEAEVEVISKKACKSLWQERYHSIIDNNMICGKNIIQNEMEQACEENQMACRELVFSGEAGGTVRRHHKKNLERRLLRSMQKAKNIRRSKHKSLRREGQDLGGFCENDHGGPLITGQGKTAVLIGIMSAYRTMNHSTRCVGPFLYTSVFNNRNLINCAINRAMGIRSHKKKRHNKEKYGNSRHDTDKYSQEYVKSRQNMDKYSQDYEKSRHNTDKYNQEYEKPRQNMDKYSQEYENTRYNIDKYSHDNEKSRHNTDKYSYDNEMSRYNTDKYSQENEKPRHHRDKRIRYPMKLVHNVDETSTNAESAETITTTEYVSKENEGLAIAFKVRRHGPPRRVRIRRRSIASSKRKSLKSKTNSSKRQNN